VNEDIALNKILGNIKKKQKVGVGDFVLGEVAVVKDNMAVVELIHGFNKVLSPADVGVLFVKNIDTRYVEKPEDCFSKGDIIKAKITEVGPYEYKLATNSPELGVVMTVCKKCKETLYGESRACWNCKSQITKKFAVERDW